MSGPPVGAQAWNPLAIVAFVLAFVAPPGAIVCGHIARQQIRRTGEQGDGFALAGLILGCLFSALIAVFVLVWSAVMATTVVGLVAVFGHLAVR